MNNDPVTIADLAEALREAVTNTALLASWEEDDARTLVSYPNTHAEALAVVKEHQSQVARWQSLLDRFDAQPPINPATDHVKEYAPDAWRNATHAAALHYWGMDYYEHDPAKLMEAVSAALYFLAPAIVRQERERQAETLRGGE